MFADLFAQTAQASDPSITQVGVTYAVVMAMLAGFGFLGKWFLGWFGKMLELLSTTVSQANVELAASTALRKEGMLSLEKIAKAFDSAVARQERIAKTFDEAAKGCSMLHEEHRKHYDALIARKKEQR